MLPFYRPFVATLSPLCRPFHFQNPPYYGYKLLNQNYKPTAEKKSAKRNTRKTKKEEEPDPISDPELDPPPTDENQNYTNLPHLLTQPLQTTSKILDLNQIVKSKNKEILTNKYIIHLKQAVEENDNNFVVHWNRRGDKIYVGNGKGKIFVFTWSELHKYPGLYTFELLQVFKVTQPSAIRLIEFARKTDKFLIVTDKLIRLYNEEMLSHLNPDKNPVTPHNIKSAKELAPYHHIKDQISRQTWRVACYSGDGEYICAGQVKQSNLSFYETAVKSENLLVKTLSVKGNDSFTDLVWHPFRSILCSITAGDVSIYTHNYIENWSAFAPDFEELEENRLYMEKENEFDESDEDKSENEEESTIDENILDITKLDRVPAYCSSDEEEVDETFLEYLPLTVEQIEMGGYIDANVFNSSINSNTILAPGLNDSNDSLGNKNLASQINSLKSRTNNFEESACISRLGIANKRSSTLNNLATKILKDKIEKEEEAGNLEVKIIDLNLGVNNSKMVHPLLIPSVKATRALKRKQEKSLEMENKRR